MQCKGHRATPTGNRHTETQGYGNRMAGCHGDSRTTNMATAPSVLVHLRPVPWPGCSGSTHQPASLCHHPPTQHGITSSHGRPSLPPPLPSLTSPCPSSSTLHPSSIPSPNHSPPLPHPFPSPLCPPLPLLATPPTCRGRSRNSATCRASSLWYAVLLP